MQKLELLAPAQNYETAIDAINCGADAVYMGASAFGARANAKNSLSDIKKVIDYAHLFNVKVYVTLNTILDDDELVSCEKLIKELYEIKTDAIIIQDFGILMLDLPPIALHASTQCDNRSVEKVEFFENIGFKRVILAREMPLNEIQRIKRQTNIELEHFVAGALCVSYSGQCYLSHYIGKRSANRGCCAQACRKKYSLMDGKGEFIAKNQYLLNLKDNNLSKHLDKLVEAGVMSFKIEGRLKDSFYVKNTVLYYHNLLKKYDRQSFGRIVQDFEPDVEKTFNRGFCDDYLFSKKDNIYNFQTPKSTGKLVGTVTSSNDNSFCIKTKEELNPQDGLCYIFDNELAGCLINRVEKIKDGFKIYPNKKINILKGQRVFRNIDVEFNKILENSKTSRKLDVSFTVFENKIELRDQRSNKIEFNLDEFEFAQNAAKMKENYLKSLSKTNDTPYFVEKIEFETNEMKFIPVSVLNNIRRELLNQLSEKILEKYKTKQQKPVDIAKFPLDKGDYRLNVHNSKAKEFYEMCSCNVLEKSFESLDKKDYSNKELMRTKHCLKRAFLDCSGSEELYLIDEKGLKFPLEFDCKNCEMVILAP